MTYLTKDDDGIDTYIALLSDWDLDAAFLGASDPCLQLKLDLKPFAEGLEDWDVITPVDISTTQLPVPQNDITTSNSDKQQSIKGHILNRVTVSSYCISFACHTFQGLSKSICLATHFPTVNYNNGSRGILL